MNTRLAAALSALATGAVLAANGCAADNPALSVTAICSPTTDCTFEASCSLQYIGFVTLDTTTSSKDNLWLFVQVDNRLENNADPSAGRVNTHDAHIDEIAIEYVGVALQATTVGVNYSVPAAGTAVVSAEVIPDALQAGPILAAIAPTAEPQEIVAKVRMRGSYGEGSRFESPEFPVTIRVCAGCATTLCGGAATCPPRSEGQRPLECIESTQ